jgi:hypothetical protein
MGQEPRKSFLKKAVYIVNGLLMFNPLFYAPAMLSYQFADRAIKGKDIMGKKISSLCRICDGIGSVSLGAVAVGVGVLEGVLLYSAFESVR